MEGEVVEGWRQRSRPGPAPALSYAFVRQEHLPVAGAGSRHDAEVAVIEEEEEWRCTCGE